MAPKSPSSFNSQVLDRVEPLPNCAWLLENQGLEQIFGLAAESNLGCLAMHRRQGTSGLRGRVWTSVSFGTVAFQAKGQGHTQEVGSFELGITLENLGQSPLLIEDLQIAQQLDESVADHKFGADQLNQRLQPIGQLVALPGEIVVLSSLRFHSDFSGQLCELLEFKLNSRAELDCIVRYAIDSSDICTRTVRESWTAFSQCVD
jgi:hypothetical protein